MAAIRPGIAAILAAAEITLRQQAEAAKQKAIAFLSHECYNAAIRSIIPRGANSSVECLFEVQENEKSQRKLFSKSKFGPRITQINLVPNL